LKFSRLESLLPFLHLTFLLALSHKRDLASAMSLKGQAALITGGAKYLGAQIALELAPLGASLALHYNSAKTKDDAVKLGETFNQEFPNTKVAFYAADLTTAAAIDKLFEDVSKDFGQIDIVVNTVGMVLKKPITEISEAEYDKMFA
jgi:NAD(P)-dependent dehydrogenase (short-subunit alcohol dehydrogenase family)